MVYWWTPIFLSQIHPDITRYKQKENALKAHQPLDEETFKNDQFQPKTVFYPGPIEVSFMYKKRKVAGEVFFFIF